MKEIKKKFFNIPLKVNIKNNSLIGENHKLLSTLRIFRQITIHMRHKQVISQNQPLQILLQKQCQSKWDWDNPI